MAKGVALRTRRSDLLSLKRCDNFLEFLLINDFIHLLVLDIGLIPGLIICRIVFAITSTVTNFIGKPKSAHNATCTQCQQQSHNTLVHHLIAATAIQNDIHNHNRQYTSQKKHIVHINTTPDQPILLRRDR